MSVAINLIYQIYWSLIFEDSCIYNPFRWISKQRLSLMDVGSKDCFRISNSNTQFPCFISCCVIKMIEVIDYVNLRGPEITRSPNWYILFQNSPSDLLPICEILTFPNRIEVWIPPTCCSCIKIVPIVNYSWIWWISKSLGWVHVSKCARYEKDVDDHNTI